MQANDAMQKKDCQCRQPYVPGVNTPHPQELVVWKALFSLGLGLGLAIGYSAAKKPKL